MGSAGAGAATRRAVAVAVLLAAGIGGLPVVAAFLDGPGTEGLVVPVHLAALAALGAVAGALLPGLAGSRGAGSGALVGALAGIGAGLVGVALFFLLLGGSGGA